MPVEGPWRAGAGVHVRVPASTANIGPAFDSIGMALGIWDDYTATVTGAELRIFVDGEGAFSIPRDAHHLVYRSMAATWQRTGVRPPPGLELVCRNAVPQGKGLGSSATATVAGVLAAQALDALRCDPSGSDRTPRVAIDRDLSCRIASSLEGHPDNAVASIHGGVTLSWYDDADAAELHTLALEVHPDVVPLVLLPNTSLPTAEARAALPPAVPHAQAALNSARAALLSQALTRRPDLLLPATRDWLHQEPRRGAFPHSMRLLDTLRAAGHAAVISGAGPSVLVLSTHARLEGARRLADERVWRSLQPGIPTEGASVERLTS